MPAISWSQLDSLRDPLSTKDRINEWIDVLKESVRLDWRRMAEEALTPHERAELRTQIKETVDQLMQLVVELERLDQSR